LQNLFLLSNHKFSTDKYGGNSMPIVKLDTRRELVSVEFHYGSYEARDGGPPECWSPGCDPFNPCWCETVCLVFSVSSCEQKKKVRAPIIRDIAEVRSSFITIDQLQQVRFQLTKNIDLRTHTHPSKSSFFHLTPLHQQGLRFKTLSFSSFVHRSRSQLTAARTSARTPPIRLYPIPAAYMAEAAFNLMLTPHAAAAAVTASTPAPLLAVQLHQLLCIGAHSRFMCDMLLRGSPQSRMFNPRVALAARLTSAAELNRLMLLPHSRQPLEMKRDSRVAAKKRGYASTDAVIVISDSD